MNDYTQQAKELVKAEDGKKAVVFVGRVFSPHQFDPSIPDFTSKQYIFLQTYRLGVPLEEAASKAGMTPETADRFLDRSDVVAWLQDRALKDHVKTQWEEPAKWWAMGNEILEGKRDFSKAQTVVFQEFGARICPKKVQESDRGTTKIEINIDPNAVQKAIDRQQAIEGELA